jgi:hypothetical protein
MNHLYVKEHPMTYPYLFVGVDVSKLKHDIAIMNESKKWFQNNWLFKILLQVFNLC